MIADGGEAISDLAVLRDQPALFGPVASNPTAWRVLSTMDSRALDRLRVARAAARETAWAQMCDTHGGIPARLWTLTAFLWDRLTEFLWGTTSAGLARGGTRELEPPL